MSEKEKEEKEVKEDYKCNQCNAVTIGDRYEDARSHADSSNHIVLGELYIPMNICYFGHPTQGKL